MDLTTSEGRQDGLMAIPVGIKKGEDKVTENENCENELKEPSKMCQMCSINKNNNPSRKKTNFCSLRFYHLYCM